MKLTNRLGLPEPIVEAVKNDGYTKGDADFSVTTLLKPPRAAVLEAQHDDEISEDASDRIWSLLGQSIHTILERANATGIAERRLSINVDGVTVSGGMDLVCKDGILTDYKVSTVWKFSKSEAPEEFIAQLNCYAEILRQNGEQVTGLQIVGIIRDWSKPESLRDPEYPQSQVVKLSVPMWPSNVALAFIKARIAVHMAAREKLPECSVEERWEKPTKWAVMKPGAKKSLKNHDNEADAIAHAKEAGAKVEIRPGEATRCKAYCRAAKFCTQYTGTGMFKPVNALEAV